MSLPLLAAISAVVLSLPGGAAEPARSAASTRRPTPTVRSDSSSRRPAPPRRPPPNQIQPGGGLDASAQACNPENSPLTAILPRANPVYTAMAHPTFLFHISDAPADLERAELIVLSADEKQEIDTVQFLPTRTGIVSVSLPTTASSGLAVGETYHWYLNVYCQNAETVLSVNGWVERVSPLDIAEAASTNTLLTEANLPAIWYDEIARTAAILATDNETDPTLTAQAQTVQRQTVQREWTQWLEAIGIGDVARVPLVGPVVPLPAS